MNAGIIYHVIHPKDPGRVRYVGKTSGTMKRREQGHWSDMNRRRSNSRLQNWLVKYAEDRGLIEFRQVLSATNPEELNELERLEIARLRDKGQADLNITEGGDGGLGLPWSQESRAKLSATLGGEGAWKAKGTWEEIREIRQRYLEGEHRRELVAAYPKFAKSTIQKILRNETWKDAEYTPPGHEEVVSRRGHVANAKLTTEQVSEIRTRATRERKKFTEWGAEYGVKGVVIGHILSNRTFPDPNFNPDSVLRGVQKRSDFGVRKSNTIE